MRIFLFFLCRFSPDFIGALTVHIDNLPRHTLRNDLLAHLKEKYNPTRIRLLNFGRNFQESFEDEKNRTFAFVTFPTAQEFKDVLKDKIRFHGHLLRISATRARKINWKHTHGPGRKKGYFPVSPDSLRCTSCQNASDNHSRDMEGTDGDTEDHSQLTQYDKSRLKTRRQRNQTILKWMEESYESLAMDPSFERYTLYAKDEQRKKSIKETRDMLLACQPKPNKQKNSQRP